MLTDELRKQFEVLGQGIVQKASSDFAEASRNVRLQAINAGQPVSSKHLQHQDLAAARVFDDAAGKAYALVMRFASADPAGQIPERVESLGQMLSRLLDMLETQLRQNLRAITEPIIQSLQNNALAATAQGNLDAAVARTRQQLAANIHLDTHTAHQTQAASTVFNIGHSSTIGAVQAGNNLTANVTQSLNLPEREEFKAALATLIALIEAEPTAAVQDKSELVELLQDARVEADKPAPNRLKISTALSTTSATVSMITNGPTAFAVAVAAWESFKALLGSLPAIG
jgi:hypothetical protein